MTWIPNRRALVAGLGATLAALTTSARPLRAQSAARGNSPARHDLDKWMDELPTKHRIFVDTASRQGGQDGVQFSGNLFNINESAYGVKNADVAVIVCFRHQSTAYGYNDAMWAKYPQFADLLKYDDPTTKKRATRNVLFHDNVMGFSDASIPGLTARGVQFTACGAATTFIAGVIAGKTGDAKAIEAELAANLVPGARMVPAGVVVLQRAQKNGYAYTFAG